MIWITLTNASNGMPISVDAKTIIAIIKLDDGKGSFVFCWHDVGFSVREGREEIAKMVTDATRTYLYLNEKSINGAQLINLN